MDAADVQPTPDGGSTYSASSDADDSQGAGKVESIDVKPSANGGFIADCRYAQSDKGSYTKPEASAFSSFDELVAYLGQKFGAAQAAPAPPDVQTETAQ